MQFDLNRNIDAAARDVQAAINAARSQLPANLPSNPTYRKVNPADAPIMILALTSDIVRQAARCTTPPRRSCSKSSRRCAASGRCSSAAARRRPCASTSIRRMLNHFGPGSGRRPRRAWPTANANRPKGQIADGDRAWSISTTDQLLKAERVPAADRRLPQRGAGAAGRRRHASPTRSRTSVPAGLSDGKPAVHAHHFPAAGRQHHRHRRSHRRPCCRS